MTKKLCVYCGRSVTNGGSMCQACREKLPFVRRIIAIGVEIKLRAAKEKALHELQSKQE